MARKLKNSTVQTVAEETAIVGEPIVGAVAQSDADEAAVVAQLEAEDAQANAVDQALEEPAIEPLVAAVAKIDDEARLEMAKKVNAAYADRETFETAKNPTGESIHKNLEKSRAKLAMPSAAAFLLAAEVDPDFINHSVNDGSRYNVYAADKLADLVAGLRDGVIRNAINNAITRSLFAFKVAGHPFTSDMAKAAASKQYPVKEKALRDLLIRHTVSPSVASTQTSSTMTALQTLGIVRNTGSVKHPVYELMDTPATARLKEVLAA